VRDAKFGADEIPGPGAKISLRAVEGAQDLEPPACGRACCRRRARGADSIDDLDVLGARRGRAPHRLVHPQVREHTPRARHTLTVRASMVAR